MQLLLIIAALLCLPLSAQVTVTVDAGPTHQLIDGWGVSERVFKDTHVYGLPYQVGGVNIVPTVAENEILDALFQPAADGGLGLNHLIATPDINTQPSNGGPYDFTDVHADFHIDLVNRIRSNSPINGRPRGLTAWWMNYIQFEGWQRSGNTVIISGSTYADYLLPIINHWRDSGAELTYMSPRNEPVSQSAPADFIRDVIIRLVNTWGSRPTKIVAPTDDSCNNTYGKTLPIIADGTAMSQLVAFTFHTYDNPWYAGCNTLRDAVASTGKKFWMAEYSGMSSNPVYLGGDEVDFAGYMHSLLNDYNVGAIYYNYGWLGSGSGSDTAALIRLDHSGTTYFGYTKKQIYYVFGQFSRWITPGSTRIDASSSSGNIQVTAVKNGNTRTIVATNNSNSPISITVNLTGFGGITSFAAARSNTSGDRWLALPDVNVSGASFSATLPSRSVTTFYSFGPSPTLTVSGTVSVASAPLSGALMTPSAGTPDLTTAGGTYSATVQYGFTGTVTPSKAGYTFSPSSRSYSNITTPQTGQDFTATLIPPSSIQNVRTNGATSTQALIAYTAPDNLPCTIQVSETDTFLQLVNDVNPSLFTGSDSDGGGIRGRSVILGKRTVNVAANGVKYSRALQANTTHYYRITCGDKLASGSFTTANIPLGGTYMDALPADPNAPGEYNWPTVSATDRTQRLIDPSSGLLISRVGLRDDTDRATDGTSGGNYDNCTINLDANGARHCIVRTSAGSNILYAIFPGTGESRLLGTVRAYYPGGSQFTSMDNANWDETQANVLYWLVLGTGYIVKGTYTGDDVAVAQGNSATPADAAITWTVLSSDLKGALASFRPAYVAADFPGCRMEGIQKRDAIVVCKHATLQGGYPQGPNAGNSQDKPAWITAFNLDTNTFRAATQIGVIGSGNNNPAAPTCTFHAYNYPGHLNGILSISLQIPTNGSEGSPCQISSGDHTGTTLVWKFLADPNGTDATGTNSIREVTVTGAHESARTPYRLMSETGTYDIVHNPSGGSVYSGYNNVAPELAMGGIPSFAGVQAPGQYYQRHASLVPGLNGASTALWGMDFTPLIAQPANATTGVSGSVYKVTNAVVNRKTLATLAMCDSKPMRDVSGPSAVFGSLTSHTYCAANNANECNSGSVAGDVYANCPAGGSAIVVSDFPAVGQAAMQIGLVTDGSGGFGRSRVLGNLFSRYKLYTDSNRYWSLKPFADQSGFFTPIFGIGTDAAPYVPNGDPTSPSSSQRSDVFHVKLPPYPGPDGLDRSDFIPVTVTLPAPPSGFAVNNAVVAFGYDSAYNCMTRNEGCVKGNQTWPIYGYTGDTITGVSCSAGCTVTLPALSGHILQWQAWYRDGSNAVIRRGGVNYVKIP